MKINFEVNIWSIGTTLAAVIIVGVTMQADVHALQQKDIDILTNIARVETTLTSRLNAVEGRSERDREALLELRGDIRVVRQILEQMRTPVMPVVPVVPPISPR